MCVNTVRVVSSRRADFYFISRIRDSGENGALSRRNGGRETCQCVPVGRVVRIRDAENPRICVLAIEARMLAFVLLAQ